MGGTISEIEGKNIQVSQKDMQQAVDWEKESCDLEGEATNEQISIKKFPMFASKNILLQKKKEEKNGQLIDHFRNHLENLDNKALAKSFVELFQQKIKGGLKFKAIPISISNFIKIKNNSIKNDYKFIEEIGEGSYGKVYKVKHLQTKDLRAIKKLKKQHITENGKTSLVNEFSILKNIDHPGIIKLYDFYENQNQNCYYVVTELCEGGSLIDFVNDYKLSETVVKSLIIQLISALNYLHNLKILHRDIKLENIVLVKKPSEYIYTLPEIKIIDFGVSLKLPSPLKDEKQSLQGSLMYMPPESLKGQLSLSWDVWSLGILIFIMLSGKLPYKAANIEELASKILDYQIEWKYSKKIDREIRNFMKKCLTKDWNMRPPISQLKEDAWLKEHRDPPLTQSKRRQTILNLINYENDNNLVSYIVNYLSSKKTKQIQRQKMAIIFNSIDTNKDGLLSEEELRKFCLENGEFSYDEEIQQIFKKIDTNGSKKIEFHQFIVMMQERRAFFDKQSIQQAFQHFELTRSGKLSKTKMRKAMEGVQNQEINYLFSKLGSDSNDMISKEQFINYLADYQVSC